MRSNLFPMNKLALFSLIALIMVAAGCNKNRRYSYWPDIDKQSAVILDSLERSTVERLGEEWMAPYVMKLDSVAEKSKNDAEGKQLRARAAFWNGIREWYAGNDSLYKEYGKRALELCDSARYPYDYARFTDEYNDSFDEQNYSRMVGNIDRFRQYKDTFNICQGMNRLAILLTFYYDNEAAIRIYDQIDGLSANSFPQINYTNKVNRAMLYEMNGDTARAVSEGAKAWNNKYGRNPRIMGFTGRMKFKQTQNPGYIREIVDRYLDRDSTLTSIPLKEMSMMLTYYVSTGQYDSDSARMIDMRLAELADNPDIALEESFKARSLYASAVGDTAKAKVLMADYDKIKNEAESARKLVKLQHKTQIDTLTSTLNEHYQTDYKVLVWCIAGLILLLAIVMVWGIRFRKKRRAEIKENEDRLAGELAISKKKLTATELSNKMKDRALSTALKSINDLRKAQPETATRTAALVAELKSSVGEQHDWELFEKLFVEMDPDFIGTLKTSYPALTQGDVRLACLLKMGMESKQIARLLNITPDSVKKNRYRLRSKLGMPTSRTFDQFFTELKNTLHK